MGTTKKEAHAAGGRLRAVKVPFDRPETVIKSADGKTAFTLRRRAATEVVPLFQKYNPRKVDPKAGGRLGPTGKPLGPAAPGSLAPRRSRSTRVPFGRLLFGAIIAHRLFVVVRDRFFPRKAAEPDSDEEEGGGDVPTSSSSPAEAPKHPRLLPAMLRAAISQPRRKKNLATRRAEAHHSRPQRTQQPTAWQRMHPTNVPKRRAPGMLEKWEAAVRKTVGGTAAATTDKAPPLLQLLPPPGAPAMIEAPLGSSRSAAGSGPASVSLVPSQPAQSHQQQQPESGSGDNSGAPKAQRQARASTSKGVPGGSGSGSPYVLSSSIPPADAR